MLKYIGVKIIHAEPMTAEERKVYFPNVKPATEEAEGYKVVYPDGYESWSPKTVFDEAYRQTTAMTFGLAVEALKKGYAVTRKGWNGKGMWLMLVLTPPTTAIHINGGVYGFLPYIQIKTADEMMVPWQPSQTDVLAEDWQTVEEA